MYLPKDDSFPCYEGVGRASRGDRIDPYSLEALVAWLETMPAGVGYSWSNCQGECLISQYFRYVTGRTVTPSEYARMLGGEGSPGHLRFAGVACDPFGVKGGHTFGAALERARAALSNHRHEVAASP